LRDGHFACDTGTDSIDGTTDSVQVTRSNAPKLVDDVLADLASFPVGTPLYSVYACGKGAGDAEMAPTTGGVEGACGDALLLGDLVTTTECTASKYGDEKFFIRHQVRGRTCSLKCPKLRSYMRVNDVNERASNNHKWQ
jgi:hypothetical protein